MSDRGGGSRTDAHWPHPNVGHPWGYCCTERDSLKARLEAERDERAALCRRFEQELEEQEQHHTEHHLEISEEIAMATIKGESPEERAAREGLWWAMRDWIRSDKPAYSTLPQFAEYKRVVTAEQERIAAGLAAALRAALDHAWECDDDDVGMCGTRESGATALAKYDEALREAWADG